jgi:hypothetical protein
MTSSLTGFKGLTLPVNLGDAGVWGTELNSGVMTVVDNILGNTTVIYSSNGLTPTLTSSMGQTGRILVYGTGVGSSGLGGNMTVTMPAANYFAGTYVIDIAATYFSSLAITFAASGAGSYSPTSYANQFQVCCDGAGDVSGLSAITAAVTNSDFAFQWIIDGGGITPSTGYHGSILSPFVNGGTLNTWSLVLDVAGSVSFDIFEVIIGTPGYVSGNVGVSITGGNYPAVSAGLAAQGGITSSIGWTTAVPTWATFGNMPVYTVQIRSAATFTRATLSLSGVRSLP